MACRKEQKARVRRQVERPLSQPVILLVHGYLNSLHATTAAPTSSAAAAPTDAGRQTAPFRAR